MLVAKEASFWINLSMSLASIMPSETEVDRPFSVEDAATAAVPIPTAAPIHPDKPKAQEISKKRLTYRFLIIITETLLKKGN
jgi:hypothetical protein